MRHKSGLVLGGGGTRGIAHIGPLRVLVRERRPLGRVCGTVMGWLGGVLVARGFAPEVPLGRRPFGLWRRPLGSLFGDSPPAPGRRPPDELAPSAPRWPRTETLDGSRLGG